METAVTAAMPPPPPDTLQECLKVAGMSADGATRFMEAHQLLTIEGMLLFRLSEAQDLMKICIGQKTHHTNKFGMNAQRNLASFIYCV